MINNENQATIQKRAYIQNQKLNSWAIWILPNNIIWRNADSKQSENWASWPQLELAESAKWGREWSSSWRFQKARLFQPRSSICDRRFPRSKSASSSNSHTLPPPAPASADSNSDSPANRPERAAVQPESKAKKRDWRLYAAFRGRVAVQCRVKRKKTPPPPLESAPSRWLEIASIWSEEELPLWNETNRNQVV